MKLKFNIPAWILLFWASYTLVADIEVWYDYQIVILRLVAIASLIWIASKRCCTVGNHENEQEGKT